MGTLNETPAQADNVEKERAQARKQLLIDYRMTFTGPQGMRVLEDLKRQLRYGLPAFQPGMSELEAAFFSGNQDAVAYILMMLTQDPNGRAEG